VLVKDSQLITNGASQGGGLYNDGQPSTVHVSGSLFQLNAPDNIEGGWKDDGNNTLI
jgi:hypothetical protein